jgi:serine/threonine protein kinase
MTSSPKLLFPSPALNGVQESTKEDFSFENKLGDGAFGQVWKIKQKKSGKTYACKIVSKATVSSMISQFRREVLIMYKLSHPHIVKLYHHFEDDENFYLVLELAEGGNLYSKLSKEKTFIERLSFKYFREILLAVEYLHSQSPAIIHRDIKPENILLSGQGKAKLTDFGWSNYYSGDKMNPRYTICGTYEYLCPEMVKESGHTPSVDIWCLGILLYEMNCGHTPFKAQTKDMLMENISKGKLLYPNSVSLPLRGLLGKILEKNPEKRITIDGIKKSEWFRKFDNVSPLRRTAEYKKEEKKIFKGKKTKSKEVQLNLYRKSIAGLQEEVTGKHRITIETKNLIKELHDKVKNEEASQKLVEREILEKQKELMTVEESIEDLSKTGQHLTETLETLIIPFKIEDLLEKVSEEANILESKSFEISELEVKSSDLRLQIDSIESTYLEKSKHLSNLTSYLKKLKEKGSMLHKTRGSQIIELQISHDCLKTRIIDIEKTLENLTTPENKFAQQMMFFIRERKEKIFEISNLQENLEKVEESICLKEVELEKIKIDHLDK